MVSRANIRYVLGLLAIFWIFFDPVYAEKMFIDPVPIAVIKNPCPKYTLINSVEFHPSENFFCATFTQGNRLVLYSIDGRGTIKIQQTLANPFASLSHPQHAVFSQHEEKLIVANWTNQTFTIYLGNGNFFFYQPPTVLASPHSLQKYKPHGIALSPCGNFLAVAYGAAFQFEKGVAVYRIKTLKRDLELVDVLKADEAPYGIPKGITFSPDGSTLLVTFSDTNKLGLFHFDKENQRILRLPRQVIEGPETGICRPEDIKLSPDGKCCAVTNSEQHTVTFYPYDPLQNCLQQSTPIYCLQNPEGELCFPHGLSFSPDGAFLAITQFGSIHVNSDGGLSWDDSINPYEARIQIYRTFFGNNPSQD